MSEHAKKPAPMGSLPTSNELEASMDRQRVGHPVNSSVSAGWSGRKPVSKEVEVPHKEAKRPR